ncbi:hypothetical protein KY335_01350, partial [Candidatus Woesearchaeota archaeon]|nr:hypothetical protein [Candidatus Woesearchaeota archaeon]
CECDLRPFTESLCPPYSKRTADDVLRDLHTDRVPTDFEVSKLQGIVYLDRHGQMIYQDRSRLGSVVNDELIVMGSRYNWDEYITDHIGIGQQKVVKMRENPNAKLEKTRLVTIERKQSMFRLHWVPYDMFPRPKRKGML